MKKISLVLVLCLMASPARADLRTRLAMEAAESVAARFGAKAAAEGLPALARKIETYAARYGEDTFLAAVRRVGPSAFDLADAAGVEGTKAMRILALHGEAGATCVLKRPNAMAQFLRYGEDGAAVMVKHPGVAEKVLERGGLPGLKAMAAVGPQSGRRIAMLLDSEAGMAARSGELLDVVAKYGDRAAAFVWNNKGALATTAALTAFLADPKPFIEGARDITKVAGESAVGVSKVAGEHVVAPVVNGVFTALNIILALIGLVIVMAVILMWKYGLPSPGLLKALMRK